VDALRDLAVPGRLAIQAVIAAASIISSIATARADVIDGTWCNGEGRYFTIKGPRIVTTDGTKTEGNYSRHAFSYTIPAPDPSAGAQVFMVLINETTVRLRLGGDASVPVETWKRCSVTS
jgi:hypothetical protein